MASDQRERAAEHDHYAVRRAEKTDVSPNISPQLNADIFSREGKQSMTTIKARFDGHVFVPDTPVHLPVGYTLEIPIPATPSDSTEACLSHLAELAGQLERLPANPDWPSDGAEQHDHYLYGTPKAP